MKLKNQNDQLKRDLDALSVKYFMLVSKHEIDSFWSFEKIREEYKAANVPFTYRSKETPEGYLIREWPDGTIETIKRSKTG